MAPATRKPLARRDRNIPEVVRVEPEKLAFPKKGQVTSDDMGTMVKSAKTGSKNVSPSQESTQAPSISGQLAVSSTTITGLSDTGKGFTETHEEKVCTDIDNLTELLSKTHLEPPSGLSSVPLPPMRPQTAYQAFAVDTWGALKTSEGPATLKEMSSRVAEKWRNAPEHLKATYEERTREARQQYEEAKREHSERLAAVEEERAALEFMRKKDLQEEAMVFFLKHRGTNCNTSDAKKEEKVKPKAARSAYNFFVTRRREEMAREGEKVSVGDVACVIAKEWKLIQCSRKKKDKQVVMECQALAHEDQSRHMRETKEYKEWVEENERKKAAECVEYRKRALEAYRAEMQDKEDAKAYRKLMTEKATQEREERKAARVAKTAEKAAKESGPKRARNAYMFFFAEKSKDNEVRAQADREKRNIATLVSEMWKCCEGEELARFQGMASADKARYAEEVGSKGEDNQNSS